MLFDFVSGDMAVMLKLYEGVDDFLRAEFLLS